MDALSIVVVAFAIILIIGGLVFAHFASKNSEKIQQQEMKKEKNGQK